MIQMRTGRYTDRDMLQSLEATDKYRKNKQQTKTTYNAQSIKHHHHPILSINL